MIVDKIHEIFSFEQSLWLEKCICFNTQKRSEAKFDFEKDFYILPNNAFYGKTMEICGTSLEIRKYYKV